MVRSERANVCLCVCVRERGREGGKERERGGLREPGKPGALDRRLGRCSIRRAATPLTNRSAGARAGGRARMHAEGNPATSPAGPVAGSAE